MSPRPSATFPRTLLKLWKATDPASQTLRTSDALDHPTPHRTIDTNGGTYWVCSETGQLERTERAVTLSDQYDDHWRGLVEQGQPDARALRNAGRLLDRFERYKTHGRMFEVACGLGTVIQAAKQQGWRPEGVEFSPFAAAHVSERCGVAIQAGAVEDVQLEPGAYDLIIMDNIFEHLFAPRQVLGRLARALRPGGALYLQTLNAQCLSLHNRPDAWIYFSEGHLYVPTLVSFDRYLDACGLEKIELDTTGFRPRPARDEKQIHGVLRSYEKIVSHVAHWTRTGHRMECVLRRKA
jgi:SAM-dependent methyltransferase